MPRAIVEQKACPADGEIVSVAVKRVRSDPSSTVLKRLPLSDLRNWLERVLAGLDRWEAGEDFSSVMHVYIDLGREAQHKGVPTKELLRAVSVLIDAAIAQRCGREWESGIYVQSSLKPLDTFCDFAKYYLVRGYQDSSR